MLIIHVKRIRQAAPRFACYLPTIATPVHVQIIIIWLWIKLLVYLTVQAGNSNAGITAVFPACGAVILRMTVETTVTRMNIVLKENAEEVSRYEGFTFRML